MKGLKFYLYYIETVCKTEAHTIYFDYSCYIMTLNCARFWIQKRWHPIPTRIYGLVFAVLNRKETKKLMNILNELYIFSSFSFGVCFQQKLISRSCSVCGMFIFSWATSFLSSSCH